MNILISNDDGIFAEGIRVLANTVAAAGHEVIVVCPDRERSATGHGLTIHTPIRAEAVTGVFSSQVKAAWACSGTPADCVKLALGALLDTPPDYVLSGINHGGNLGTDVLYSGTVSAAMEGSLEGIPSLAISLASFTSQNFQPAADFVVRFLPTLGELAIPATTLLNVNVPAVAAEAIQGVQITQQGVRRYFDLFEKRLDPRGKTYYWLAGEILEDIEPQSQLQAAIAAKAQTDPNIRSAMEQIDALPTDVSAIRANYITVTPLQYNLTCQAGLLALPQSLSTTVPSGSGTNPAAGELEAKSLDQA